MTRIFVSGLGLVASCGDNVENFWRNVVRGESAFHPYCFPSNKIVPIGKIDESVYKSKASLCLNAQNDRNSVLAIGAIADALRDAEFEAPFVRPDRIAIVVGVASGSSSVIEDGYRRLFLENKRPSPYSIVHSMANGPVSWASIVFGVQGPSFVISSACASATHAVGIAASLIQSGMVDVAITGGTDAPVTLGVLSAWNSMKMLSQSLCRPFSNGRDGVILSEAAGVLILEAEHHFRERKGGKKSVGAIIELAGFSANANARHIVAPHASGMAQAMRHALDRAALRPQDIDYINAHGTGSLANDVEETKAIKQLFEGVKIPPISSIKGVTGHAPGAGGALDAIATIMAMRANLAPPTANYLAPDPACDLDYIPNIDRPLQINAALSNSFAFGGLNACLIFRQVH